MTARSHNKKEVLNASLVILVGGWIWWYSGRFPDLEEGYPGPSLFPRLISVGLILAGVGLFIDLLFGKPILSVDQESGTPDKRHWIRLLSGIGLIIIYPFLQPLIGFIPTLAIICFFIAVLLKVRIWLAASTALITVLLIYLVFTNLLGVAL